MNSKTFKCNSNNCKKVFETEKKLNKHQNKVHKNVNEINEKMLTKLLINWIIYLSLINKLNESKKKDFCCNYLENSISTEK